MSMVAGFWECELTRVVQKIGGGGAVRILNDAGREAIVRVEKFDPARFGTDTYCY